MAIPVSAVARRKQYTVGASGQQGPYAFTFNILADADLAVYVNSTLKTITTHYLVTTAADGTGSITFVAGQYPSEDDTVTLIGAKAIARTSDFTAGGDIKASTFNTELDTITIVQQQLEEIDDRSLQLDIHTTRDVSGATGPLVWPYGTTAANASKVVAYTAAGNALELTDKAVSSASVSASNVAVTAAQAAGTATASISLSSAGALAFTLGIPVGATGMAGGVSMQYSTTTADADPGVGFVRFNNTSLNSATIMYVDDNDGTSDISAWVQSWDNSVAATRGYITICGNPNFASPLVIFKVNGAVTDASTYTKIPVAYVAGSTSISNTAEISVQFSPSGEGSHPGLDYTFSTTTADADPGAGVIRLNHATLASVSAAYLDDTDANSVNVSTHVLTWDDSTHTSLRGYVKIVKKTAPSTYALYSITGASTDASGYNKLVLTHINSNGSFAASDPVSVHFTRTGDDGTDADNVFRTISVAGQDNVVADSTTDTLTLAAGSNITITTTAATDTITIAGAASGAPAAATSAKTAAYTVVAGDAGSTILCSAASAEYSVALTAAATLGNGFTVTLKKSDDSKFMITISPSGSETIDGLLDLKLRHEHASVTLICDGSNFHIISHENVAIEYNAVENAGCEVDQYSHITRTGLGGSSLYLIDRWKMISNGTASARWTFSQESAGGTDGKSKWLKMLCTTPDASPSAAEGNYLQQKFMGNSGQIFLGTDGLFENATYSMDIIGHLNTPDAPYTAVIGLTCLNGTQRVFLEEVAIAADAVFERIYFTIPEDATADIDPGTSVSFYISVSLYGGSNVQASTGWTGTGGNETATSGGQNWASAANNYLGFTKVVLAPGQIPPNYADVVRTYEEELNICKYYAEKLSYDTNGYQLVAIGGFSANNAIQASVTYEEKRATPAITSSAAGTFQLNSYAVGGNDATSVGYNEPGKTNFRFAAEYGGTGYTQDNAGQIRRDATDDTYIFITAEI